MRVALKVWSLRLPPPVLVASEELRDTVIQTHVPCMDGEGMVDDDTSYYSTANQCNELGPLLSNLIGVVARNFIRRTQPHREPPTRPKWAR